MSADHGEVLDFPFRQVYKVATTKDDKDTPMQTKASHRPPRQLALWHVGSVLAALMAFASISTDFYLPAMPEMAKDLAAAPGQIELTITGYLVGISLGQLVWGPLSDGIGRRLPIALGIVLFLIGSAGCGLSADVTSIILWRVVQAVGAAASIVLSRAMVRDLYEGNRAAQVMSLLMAVMTIAPLVAPSVGAQIVSLWGWRMIFAMLVLIGLVTLAALFTLPETLPRALPRARSVRQQSGAPDALVPSGPASGVIAAFAGYGRLLRNRPVMAHALVCGFYYVGMFAYVAGSPFVFIDYHHLSPSLYGLIFSACVVSITLGNIVNARLVVRIGRLKSLQIGGAGACLFGAILALTTFSDLGGAWGVFLPLLGFVSCTGLILPNALSGALESSTNDAGAISALCGAIQYGGGIFGSGLVGLCADGTAWPLGLVLAGAGAGALIFSQLLARRG
ncbi:multidrug effflux MFS transporter [uncultured Cohaesibacter sp.]|uniref:multidrug effflux MFS transporter n=1 Tax=uncultured Cohaesibacter sp. TaxID=1002546 RepID=UPI0029C834A1|nr:multidrug effflux MFS transporter [uncultured Cohaesibacter sp.]